MIKLVIYYFLYDIAINVLFDNIIHNFSYVKLKELDPKKLIAGNYICIHINTNITDIKMQVKINYVTECGGVALSGKYNGLDVILFILNGTLIDIVGAGSVELFKAIGMK